MDDKVRRSGRFPHNSLLWLLAAVLGAVTVHGIATTLHDTSQHRAAASIVTRAMAERVTLAAGDRLETVAVRALAPALGLATGAAQSGRSLVASLVREQQLAEDCECRATLPVMGFFRAARADGVLDVAMMREPAGAMPPELRDALAAIARSETVAGEPGSMSTVHLRADSALGDDAAVTSVQRDAHGNAVAVVGFLVSRRALSEWLFSDRAMGDPLPERDGDPPLAWLDSLSLEVRTADGQLFFGRVAPEWRFHATVEPAGPLNGLAITVALAADQIAPPLIAPVAARQLWHLGMLMLSTLLVLAIAVRSSRREALLARARSDFIAGVSHELRMPLAQILLASETLTMQRERGEAQRMTLTHSILREARRLIALVENVLLFSRTGAVELRPNLQPVPVDELLADVVEAVQLAVDDVDQSIETAAAPALAVIGDRPLLRQALVNLVDNAMKYGAAGQRIRLVAESPSSGLVRLIVDDDGRGVPHAQRARVFEPYERLARDQVSERTGTGLGLAVVRQIVTACKGRVWLEQTPGGGTRAVIELAASAIPRPATPPSAVA